MLVRIIGSEGKAKIAAEKVVVETGHTVWNDGMYYESQEYEIDLNIAPLLTVKIPADVVREPRFGTLIFHPSPLPYGRGAASIKHAYQRKEPLTAATWFWADDGLDTGTICEQEIVRIDYNLSPKEFYEQEIIPTMCRTLKRCLNELSIGYKREIKQIDKYSSYDRKL
jgi:formyltetrahydrofolate dehydrogenase